MPEPGLASRVAAIAAEAGRLAMARWETEFRRWEKVPGSPVCDVDLEVDALLRQRLRVQPTDVAAIRLMAELAARIGRLGDAEKLLRRALELAQQSVKAGLALPAVALEAEMNWREAEADLTGARLQRHVAGLRLHFLTGELANGPVNNR